MIYYLRYYIKQGGKKDWQVTSDEATMELFRGRRGSCWGGVGADGCWECGPIFQLLNGSVSFQPSITHYMTVNNQGELN